MRQIKLERDRAKEAKEEEAHLKEMEAEIDGDDDGDEEEGEEEEGEGRGEGRGKGTRRGRGRGRKRKKARDPPPKKRTRSGLGSGKDGRSSIEELADSLAAKPSGTVATSINPRLKDVASSPSRSFAMVFQTLFIQTGRKASAHFVRAAFTILLGQRTSAKRKREKPSAFTLADDFLQLVPKQDAEVDDERWERVLKDLENFLCKHLPAAFRCPRSGAGSDEGNDDDEEERDDSDSVTDMDSEDRETALQRARDLCVLLCVHRAL